MKYVICDGMPKNQYANLVKDIFGYLKNVKGNGNYKIYIDGEYDSNQTMFETESNNCQIGVIADSAELGYSLLFFLRMIIDDRADLLEFFLLDGKQYINLTLAEVMNIIRGLETAYTDVFEINDPIKRILGGSDDQIEIVKSANDIDLWTRDRIEKEFMDRFNL